MNSFYSRDELINLGLGSYGSDILISRRASIYSPESIHLGSHVRIDDFCVLSGKFDIGNYVHIGASCLLLCGEGLKMGDFSGLSGRVSVYTSSDDYFGEGLTNPTVPMEFRKLHSGPVRLERHVIVGAGAIILPNVTVGEGAAVGALSLVTSSLRPWFVAAGNPARGVKERRRDLIERYQHELEARPS